VGRGGGGGALVLSLTATNIPSEYTDDVHTGEPGDALEIEDIRVSPDPPRPGHNLTIYASGRANTLVTVRPLPSLTSSRPY
jgi:hypothetical protein